MTLPLFLLGAGALAGAAPGTLLRLDGEEGRHAVAARRIRVGELLDLSDGCGAVARGEVRAVGRDHLDLAVAELRRHPARSPRLVLVQALAKGGRDEQAVETATEYGVDAVLPWSAERSVVVWQGERGEKARRRWESVARAATKQSRRPWLPEVEPAVTTAALARRVPGTAATLVLHEDAEQPLTAAPLPPSGQAGDVLVVVGPEGGIAPAELDTLVAAGARAVRLGPEVLRSSSAGPAALAVLAVRLGRWA